MDISDSQLDEILIVGAGVMGLSTALTILNRAAYAHTKITIVDAAPELPNFSAASIDTSRILRADYAVEAYTKLVSEAREAWKDQTVAGWGGEGRYHDAALLLTEQPGIKGHMDDYLKESLENLRHLMATNPLSFNADTLIELHNAGDILENLPFPGVSGTSGYLNKNCGWVNAEACIRYALRLLREAGPRVVLKCNTRVHGLLVKGDEQLSQDPPKCLGAEIEDGSQLRADLTVIAAGAWTPSLVDLGGRAAARGQVLSYLNVNDAEQQALEACPIYFNVSRGMYLLPPHHNELKVGRHGYGYDNPRQVIHSKLILHADKNQREETHSVVSVPWTSGQIPREAEVACKEFLGEVFPQWRQRQFERTRLCWYCDTPEGDFLIDYNPNYSNLFIATGDSGHAFKVLPVIGEKIADAIERNLDAKLQRLWRWTAPSPKDFQWTSDGTRGGKRGMLLHKELM